MLVIRHLFGFMNSLNPDIREYTYTESPTICKISNSYPTLEAVESRLKPVCLENNLMEYLKFANMLIYPCSVPFENMSYCNVDGLPRRQNPVIQSDVRQLTQELSHL